MENFNLFFEGNYHTENKDKGKQLSKRKCRILIPIGCRSDAGLSAPVIKRLRDLEWCVLYTLQLYPANYIESYEITQNHLNDMRYGRFDCPNPNIHFDLVIITGDRIEMMACAQCCFLNNIKIAHFGAGIINSPISTYDDVNRHCITLMSDIAFCEDLYSGEIVWFLWYKIGKIPYLNEVSLRPFKMEDVLKYENIHIVGISHLDDLEIDESLVPNEPYDLVLYNPPTHFSELGNKTLITKELDVIIKLLKLEEKTIFIDSNPDPYNDLNLKYFISKDNPHFEFKYKIPRPQFFGLLKNCSRYITNSSNINYEALPLGLKPEQIIQIVLRNKNRSTPKKLETGASQKIVNILKKWWEKQNE